jgi:hypothetical protein
VSLQLPSICTQAPTLGIRIRYEKLSRLYCGRGRGIRTPEWVPPSTVFETVSACFSEHSRVPECNTNSITYGRWHAVLARLKSTTFLPRICTDICTAIRCAAAMASIRTFQFGLTRLPQQITRRRSLSTAVVRARGVLSADFCLDCFTERS